MKALVPWQDMGKHPDKYFLPEYVPKDYVIVEPSRMTGTTTISLITHWINRVDQDLEPFRFKDLSPKVPFKRYRRSSSRKSSESVKDIDLDSSDDPSTTTKGKSTRTTSSSRRNDTPPTSEDDSDPESELDLMPNSRNAPKKSSRRNDEDTDLTPASKNAPKHAPPREPAESTTKSKNVPKPDTMKDKNEEGDEPTPKSKKVPRPSSPDEDGDPKPTTKSKKAPRPSPVADADPTPRPKRTRRVDDQPSPASQEVVMMKIGPPKKSVRKIVPATNDARNESPTIVQPAPKPSCELVDYFDPLTVDEPFLEDDEYKQPIALSGPLKHAATESTRYRFLRTLSSLPLYQQLVKDIRTLPPGYISNIESPKLAPWANWDQREHCIPRELHMDKDEYSKFLDWMMDHPFRNTKGTLVKRTAAEHVVLAIGMTLRDIHVSNNFPKSRAEVYPDFIQQSTIPFEDVDNHFMSFCETFSFSIKSWKDRHQSNDPNMGSRAPIAVVPKVSELTKAPKPISPSEKVPESSSSAPKPNAPAPEGSLVGVEFPRTKPSQWSKWKASQPPEDPFAEKNVPAPPSLRPIPPPPPRPSTSDTQTSAGKKHLDELIIRTRAQAERAHTELMMKRKAACKRPAQAAQDDEISEGSSPRKRSRATSNAGASVRSRSPRKRHR